jgi:hypothetical protein
MKTPKTHFDLFNAIGPIHWRYRGWRFDLAYNPGNQSWETLKTVGDGCSRENWITDHEAHVLIEAATEKDLIAAGFWFSVYRSQNRLAYQYISPDGKCDRFWSKLKILCAVVAHAQKAKVRT